MASLPRIHCPLPLTTGMVVDLPTSAARHIQVLRLQPGGQVSLFNGEGGEFEACITHMGRQDVQVKIGAYSDVERELATQIHLVMGVPGNERMDWVVEKATELGVASIQPLITERSVWRLHGERAEKKQRHWQAVAIAACEQCGRNRLPKIHAVADLLSWLKVNPFTLARETNLQCKLWLLSPATGVGRLQTQIQTKPNQIVFLSGPEGGLSVQEETLAITHGFQPASLGDRILRADTAPLAALMSMAREN